MDIQFLLWLQGLRTPVLNALNYGATLFAEEAVLLVVLCVLFWCINKKSAQFIILNFIAAMSVNNILKVIFCTARPWLRDPRVQPYEKAVGSATGYSFPSGHTACATSVYGSFALFAWAKKRWVSVLMGLIILFVGISRMYMGVHTPQDVLVSLAAGIFLIAVVRVGQRWLDAHPEKDIWVLGGMLALALGMLLFTYYKPYPEATDRALLQDAYKTAGSVAGIALGWFIERRWVRFDVKAPLWYQIVKTVVGVGGILALRAALKPVCAALVGEEFAGAVRYFLIMLWAICLWPLAFKKLQERFVK